jgi:hypothetical protein
VEPFMVKSEIESMKKELNRLIDSEAGFNKVYEISVRLDRLIVRYYTENEKRSL